MSKEKVLEMGRREWEKLVCLFGNGGPVGTGQLVCVVVLGSR